MGNILSRETKSEMGVTIMSASVYRGYVLCRESQSGDGPGLTCTEGNVLNRETQSGDRCGQYQSVSVYRREWSQYGDTINRYAWPTSLC